MHSTEFLVKLAQGCQILSTEVSNVGAGFHSSRVEATSESTETWEQSIKQVESGAEWKPLRIRFESPEQAAKVNCFYDLHF